MNAYALAAIPPTLLLIADWELWPYVFAVAGVAAVVVAVMLWLDGKALRREVADLRVKLTEARLTNPATATTVRIPSMTRHLSLVQSDDDFIDVAYRIGMQDAARIARAGA